MGQRSALRSVDELLHGHCAGPAPGGAQELRQGEVRGSSQHPDPRGLPLHAGMSGYSHDRVWGLVGCNAMKQATAMTVWGLVGCNAMKLSCVG